jgi:hypothetical protein
VAQGELNGNAVGAVGVLVEAKARRRVHLHSLER